MILAGVRVSVTIGIGTATIGSTVGALTLGTPIFDGIGGNKVPFVLQGAILVALFAIVTDMAFARLEIVVAAAGRSALSARVTACSRSGPVCRPSLVRRHSTSAAVRAHSRSTSQRNSASVRPPPRSRPGPAASIARASVP